MRTVRDIADELYALVPTEFTAARDRYVAEAREAGEKSVAAEVGKLRRPTVSAWLVNLLALRAPSEVERLLEVGEAIRTAQGSVPPAQLRDLSTQRRRAIDAALRKAEELARAAGGETPSRQQITEVESTLAAAMADEAVADLVRAGRVVRPLTYSGFGVEGLGGFDATAARAGTQRATGGDTARRRGAAPTSETPAKAPPAEREAADRRRAAEEQLAAAKQHHAEAMRAEEEANEHVARLTAQINELREQLDRAQHEARLRRNRRMAAERDLNAAQRRLDRLS